MICKECKQVVEGDSIEEMRKHWAGAHPKGLRDRTHWVDREFFLSLAGLEHQVEPTDTRNDDYSDRGVGAKTTPSNRRRSGPIQVEDL